MRGEIVKRARLSGVAISNGFHAFRRGESALLTRGLEDNRFCAAEILIARLEKKLYLAENRVPLFPRDGTVYQEKSPRVHGYTRARRRAESAIERGRAQVPKENRWNY